MPDENYKHLESKGCKLVSAQKIVGKVNIRGRTVDRTLYFLMCLTHGADVCRCGWEFSHHPISQNEPHFSPAEMMALNIKIRRKQKQIVQPKK